MPVPAGYQGSLPGLGGVLPFPVPRAQTFCEATEVAVIAALGLKSANTPAAALTSATGAAGLLTGAYYYKYRYVSVRGYAGPLSAISTVISPAAQQVALTAVSVDPNTGDGCLRREIFRSKANPPNAATAPGSIEFYFLGSIEDNTTTTFTDNVADSALGPRVQEPGVSPGMFYGIAVNAAAAVATTIVVYDNLNAASGNAIYRAIVTGIAGGSPIDFSLAVPIICRNGITVSVAGAASTATVYWS